MNEKLSKSDKIILSNIEWNARITNKELAKLCNLSKDGVKYRIKRLENKKIITKYKAIIDNKKLGQESYKIYLKIQTTRTNMERIKTYLATKKEVFAYFESRGNWNLGIAYFAKNSKEYYKLENELQNKFGEYIIEKKLCQMVEATIQTNKAINEEMKFKEYKLWDKIENKQLDETKKIILKEINKNPKITLHELCAKTNKSIETIMRKKKELEEEKIIALYSTTINYQKIGIEIYKIFIYVKKFNQEVDNKLTNYFKELNQTRDIIKTIGPWKLEIELAIKNHEEYEQIIEELLEQFENNIQNIEYSIFRNETFHPKE